MSGRSMALDVMVRLKDHMSRPLRGLMNNFRKIGDVARRIGMVGAAVSAISFMAPIQSAAAFQQQLIDIAGTAELTGAEAFKFVDQAKEQYEGLAFEIGQHSDTIAKGAGQMIAAGVDRSLIDATIGDIGRAATAANAEFSDMAGVGTAMLNNLKLPADQMRDSLGALVIAGKEGSFELKDMAQHFPRLTSQVAKFGVKGREAVNFLGSALQIAMKGTSDPSIAANNLSNFLSKALSERTVKNFAEMGVDLQAVMQDAATKGINPLEAVLQKVGVLTGVGEKEIGKYMKAAEKNGLKGADALAYVRQQLEAIGAAGKVSELFSDQQVLDFIVPFMANMAEYKDIKEKVSAATGAAIDADFDTQMKGMNRQLAIFNEIGTQSAREVGFAFGEWLPLINKWLLAGIRWVREFNQSTGGLVKQFLVGAGGVLLVVAALGTLGVVLPIVSAGLGAIGAIAGLLLGPVGLVIAALAGGAYLVWKNWDKVKPHLAKAWEGIKAGASRAWQGIKAGWSRLEPYFEIGWRRLQQIGGRAWEGIKAGARWAWQSIKAGWDRLQPALEQGWSRLKEVGGRLWASLSEAATSALASINFDNLKLGGLEALDAILGRIKSGWESLKAIGEGIAPSLSAMGESLKGAFAAGGETWNNLGRIASAVGSLAAGLGKLLGLGDGGRGWQTIGKMLGAIGSVATGGIEIFAKALASVTGAIADLLEWAAGGKAPDWKAWFPDWVVGAIEKISAAIDKVKSAIAALSNMKMPAWGNLFGSAGPAASDADSAAAAGARIGRLVPANGNNPSRPVAAPAQPPVRQEVNVGGAVKIVVDGPGKVAGVESENKSVPVTAGRMVGRV